MNSLQITERWVRKSTQILFLLSSIFICGVPSTLFGAVYISEIAWMGTAVSANDEWIELYNDGSSAVNLSGWALSASDGSPAITLEGSIGGNSFFLLERSDDESAPSVPADHIYSGALGNEGEILSLWDGSGAEVDSVSMADGWSAGDNTTKNTMQKSGANWITGSPTPKADNATVDQGSGGSNDTDSDADSGSNTADASAHTSAKEISSQNETARKNVTLYAGRNRSAIVGQHVYFSGELVDSKDNLIAHDSYRWNFGDGMSMAGRQVRHQYLFPGTYVVVLTAEYGEETYTSRLEVLVSEVSVEVVETGHGYVALKNNADTEMNLSDWEIRQEHNTYYIPKDTIILPQAVLKLRHPFEDINVVVVPSGYEARQGFNIQEITSTHAELTQIGAEVQKLSAQINAIAPRPVYAVAPLPSTSLHQEIQSTDMLPEEQVAEERATTTALSATVLFEGEQESLIGKIKQFFVRLFSNS